MALCWNILDMAGLIPRGLLFLLRPPGMLLLQRHSLTSSSNLVPPSSYSFHPGFRDSDSDSFKESFCKSFLIYEDFISEAEEENLCREVDPHLKRLVYEKDHWDEAIVGFRETERKHWNTDNAPVIQRIREFAFDAKTRQKLLPFVHVLDLAEDGHIKVN